MHYPHHIIPLASKLMHESCLIIYKSTKQLPLQLHTSSLFIHFLLHLWLLLLTGPLLKVAILSNKSKKTQRIKTKTFKKINPRIQKEIPNLKKTRQQAKKKMKNIYAKQIRKFKKKVLKKIQKKTAKQMTKVGQNKIKQNKKRKKNRKQV